MAEPTRRTIMTAAAVAPLAASLRLEAAEVDRIDGWIKRYAGFGDKPAGGAGDTASGEWLEAEMTQWCYAVRRQSFSTPYFEPEVVTLAAGAETATIIAQAPVRMTPAGGMIAPLVAMDSYSQPRALKGAITLARLRFNRWSSATSPEVQAAINAAAAQGAAAVLLVTDGRSGLALALNAPADAPPLAVPVATIAPGDALRVFKTGAPATLRIEGHGGVRPAYNLFAALPRSNQRTLVISTPRSGWFGCVGERGPGIAVWLALARAYAQGDVAASPLFVATSGHEYENLGAVQFLHDGAPDPAQTALWVHLGANVAARDWQDLGARLLPLSSAESQRFLVVSAGLLPAARTAFAGQPGLEMPHDIERGAAGELSEIAAAGYGSVAGVFGAHRYHHARSDDLRCVEPARVAQAAMGFRTLIAAALDA